MGERHGPFDRTGCAYQGEPGAYSEGCAADVFAAAGRPCEFVGLGSFDEVFASLAAGNVDYAAVPVENTLGGSIHVNYDLLLRYHGQVHILGEHVHRVRHCLLALPGVRKESMTAMQVRRTQFAAIPASTRTVSLARKC